MDNQRFEPRDRNFRARVERSFARQAFMTHIGARLSLIEPGRCEIVMGWRAELCQQHGYFHAATTAAIADSAAGYAALSLFEAGAGVLTAEFKINLLNPARGECLTATGRVVKPGRTLSVCHADVFASEGGEEVHVATALLTMMQVPGLDG